MLRLRASKKSSELQKLCVLEEINLQTIQIQALMDHFLSYFKCRECCKMPFKSVKCCDTKEHTHLYPLMLPERVSYSAGTCSPLGVHNHSDFVPAEEQIYNLLKYR